MSTKNEEQKEMFKKDGELSGEIEELNRSEELLDGELESVEGGGTCVCKSGNTNNTTVPVKNEPLEPGEPK